MQDVSFRIGSSIPIIGAICKIQVMRSFLVTKVTKVTKATRVKGWDLFRKTEGRRGPRERWIFQGCRGDRVQCRPTFPSIREGQDEPWIARHGTSPSDWRTRMTWIMGSKSETRIS